MRGEVAPHPPLQEKVVSVRNVVTTRPATSWIEIGGCLFFVLLLPFLLMLCGRR
jgi:hypothetical protein